jgi:hypothetical protein
MLSRIFIGIISALLFFSKIEASIEQIGSLAGIEQSTDKDSLVLFNITNTL